jgi:predicted dehydrogenase
LSRRIGVAGYGRWGANVVRDLLSLSAEVTVADPLERQRHRALEAGASGSVASAEELPTDCDGYVVVTPASTHRSVCEQLLPRGKPIFLEKPPCTDVVDLEALAEQADDLFVMHKWRYHPGVKALESLVTSGRLGTPRTLETTRTGPEALPEDVDVLWHLGTHDLSIAVEILGVLPPVHDVDATRDAGGRICGCRVTMRGDGPSHEMVLGAEARSRVRRVVVVGSEATAVLERPDAPALALHHEGGVEHIDISPAMPLAAELRAFFAYLAGGPPPVSDAATALAILRRLTDIGRMASREAT